MPIMFKWAKNANRKTRWNKIRRSTSYKNLSEEYDEEGTLDRLNNLIVVCSNHHKMLHYHKGGYRKIKIVNEVLAFVNDSEEVIPIITNKHLKSDE